MYKLMTTLLSFLFLSTALQAAVEKSSSPLNWVTSYEEAVNQSKSTSKPIILFFTGSDWCGWCHKLEREALDTADFAQAAGDKFIFVKLDFPMNSQLPSNLTAQNKQLQKKYDVRGFPTIIILDSQERQIGTTGYRSGGGAQYAQHLFKIVNDYTGYQQKMQAVDAKEQLSGLELRQLYDKAKEFDLENDAIKIIRLGMNSDQKGFFLLEHYRFLINEGKSQSPEAVSLRLQLLKSDPQNTFLTHYHVAVIDFEAENSHIEDHSVETVVAPLVNYINQFGSTDKANLWRLHMIVSQVYFDKNNISKALEHAKAAHDQAPSTVQPEIAVVIKSIQTDNALMR